MPGDRNRTLVICGSNWNLFLQPFERLASRSKLTRPPPFKALDTLLPSYSNGFRMALPHHMMPRDASLSSDCCKTPTPGFGETSRQFETEFLSQTENSHIGCPRDWRLSVNWRTNEGAPLNPSIR